MVNLASVWSVNGVSPQPVHLIIEPYHHLLWLRFWHYRWYLAGGTLSLNCRQCWLMSNPSFFTGAFASEAPWLDINRNQVITSVLLFSYLSNYNSYFLHHFSVHRFAQGGSERTERWDGFCECSSQLFCGLWERCVTVNLWRDHHDHRFLQIHPNRSSRICRMALAEVTIQHF